jgi:hydroxymethylglutaryl-CoA lyase
MRQIEIIEVSPRDGIQNEKVILDTETKLELVERSISAGIKRLEVTSFVNPKRVPQMFDSAELVARLPRGKARYIGLVLNKRGFERAVECGVDEANFVVVASDTFNLKNQGAKTAETLGFWSELAQDAKGKIDVGLTIGAAFGCPFEGEMPLARVLKIIEKAMATPPMELSVADTIGVACPADIRRVVGAIKAEYPNLKLRLHLHNTRNTGIANALAGIEAGVDALDSSMGGSGGCPFAPRATGNIATEDLVYMMERSGFSTGLNLDACIQTADWLEKQLQHDLPGMVMKAGDFTPIAAG